MSEKVRNKKFIDRIFSDKKIHYFLVVILAIVAVFVCLGGINNTKEEQVTFSSNDYVSSLEKRWSESLSTVDGAGKVSVIITVESGMETVLAKETVIKETASGKETVETPIIVNGKTVVLKELYPKISGVVIVSEGASRIYVMKKIQQAKV